MRPSADQALTVAEHVRKFYYRRAVALRRMVRLASLAGPSSKKEATSLAIITALLVCALLALTQTMSLLPLNPVTLSPTHYSSPDVWITGEYGNSATMISGNYTLYGTTLLLGRVGNSSGASATWSIPFNDAAEFNGVNTTYSVYVPGSLFFSVANSSLRMSFDGLNASYVPGNETTFSWHSGPLWTPNATDLKKVPPDYRATAPYSYVVFNHSALQCPSTVVVTVKVPAHGEIYIPDIIISASLDYNQFVPETATQHGVELLPVYLILLGVGVFVAIRLGLRYCARLTFLGIAIRLLLAPWFMHPDLVVLARYPQLLYNYGFLDFLSFSYGPIWLAQTLLGPAPLYALGVNPTLLSYNFLLKIPMIGVDALTFLVIAKFLQRWFEREVALKWAAIGWLLNPLVIYFTAIHGIASSTVALFLACGLLGLSSLASRVSIAGFVGAVMVLSATVVVVPLLLTVRSLSLRARVLLVALPAVLYFVIVLSLYRNFSALFAYFSALTLRTGQGSISLGAATQSSMTPMYVAYLRLGVYVTPEVGLALLLSMMIVFMASGYRLSGKAVYGAVYFSMMVFFVTYAVFYAHHLVWVLPVIVILLAQARVTLIRASVFMLVLSLTALVVNFLGFWDSTLNELLSFVLFSLMLSPILISPFFPKIRRQVWKKLYSMAPYFGFVSSIGLVIGLNFFVLHYLIDVLLLLASAFLFLRQIIIRRAGGRGIGAGYDWWVRLAICVIPLVGLLVFPLGMGFSLEMLAVLLGSVSMIEQLELTRGFLVRGRRGGTSADLRRGIGGARERVAFVDSKGSLVG